MLQVLLVVPVGAVLVLNLEHDHWTALCDLPGHHQGQHRFHVGRNGGKVPGFAAADAHGGVGEQPRGQPAVVPLGANVGAGSDNRVHPGIGHQVQEAPKVQPAVGKEGTRSWRVLVPRHVGLDGVQSHQPGLVDPVGPQIGVHPEVVDGSGKDAERFIVQEKVLIADCEGFQSEVLTGSTRSGARRGRRTKRCSRSRTAAVPAPTRCPAPAASRRRTR